MDRRGAETGTVELTDTSRVVRRADVSLTRTGDEAVLVDEARGSVHVVNHTAARLWELCDGSPTVGELVGSMADDYEVDAKVVQPDVERMLGTFRELGLLEWGEA
jgi:PqqD family protein of HPr-rel-A system